MITPRRLIKALVITLFVVGILASPAISCYSKEKVVKIGITQIVTHPSLDLARKGFIDALKEADYVEGKNVKYDLKNAHGDMATAQTIAKTFVDSKVDLIFSIATPTSQAVVKATPKIPIVYAAVTDPVASGLVKSMQSSGNNVTGVSDMWPIEDQIKLFLKLVPSVKKMGIIYNPGETNSLIIVDMAEKACQKVKVELVKATVSNSNEVFTAAQSLVGRVDAMSVLGDNTVVSAFEAVVKVANENKIPLFVGETDSVKRGGLATLGTNYYHIGYAAGQKAIKILKGAHPSDIPSEVAKQFDVHINMKAAKAMNVKIPEDFWYSQELWISSSLQR